MHIKQCIGFSFSCAALTLLRRTYAPTASVYAHISFTCFYHMHTTTTHSIVPRDLWAYVRVKSCQPVHQCMGHPAWSLCHAT